MLLLKQRGVGTREALALTPRALRSCAYPPSQAAWGSPCQPGPQRSWMETAGTRTERLVTSVSQKPTFCPKARQHPTHLAPPTPIRGKSQARDYFQGGRIQQATRMGGKRQKEDLRAGPGRPKYSPGTEVLNRSQVLLQKSHIIHSYTLDCFFLYHQLERSSNFDSDAS